jgi:hypothetical protein
MDIGGGRIPGIFPFAKDGYRNLTALLTSLSTVNGHERQMPLAIKRLDDRAVSVA